MARSERVEKYRVSKKTAAMLPTSIKTGLLTLYNCVLDLTGGIDYFPSRRPVRYNQAERGKIRNSVVLVLRPGRTFGSGCSRYSCLIWAPDMIFIFFLYWALDMIFIFFLYNLINFLRTTPWSQFSHFLSLLYITSWLNILVRGLKSVWQIRLIIFILIIFLLI